jgi:alginate O-acetyltransferase complex protein AlgI
MLFTEPAFLFIFLPALLAIYFLTPERGRNYVLTLASLAFYAIGEKGFVLWLLGSTALNYAVALGINRWRGTPRARAFLAAGIGADLMLLIVFKYAQLFGQTLNTALAAAGMPLLAVPYVALPLGISFFTFHKISYKVDVYHGVAPVRRDPMDLLLYILLFPQLIAGPIVRYHEIAEALAGPRRVTLADFSEGIRRFAIGMAKKMLVANSLAQVADPVFALSAADLSMPLIWIGLSCYAFQIYFDFSGYSDMAIGLARMFGFRFPENFNFPYIARSITDFWRRWHMSLSRWFRDYLYIPLGGNRASTRRTYGNLVLVFLLCGFWHGANWTFLLWGLFHGLALVIERLGLGRWLASSPAIVARAYTWLVLLVGWAIFRSDSLGQLGTVTTAMVGLGPVPGVVHLPSEYVNRETMLALAFGLLSTATPWAGAWARLEAARETGGTSATLPGAWWLEPVSIIAVLLACIGRVAADTYNPFIYFRF